jgi:hypothetical protein
MASEVDELTEGVDLLLKSGDHLLNMALNHLEHRNFKLRLTRQPQQLPSATVHGSLRTAPRDGLSEVMTQVRDQLGVSRMVHGLETDDPLGEGVIVLLCEPEEVQLRLRRADDEDLTVILERLRHLPKETMLVVGMIPDPQVLLVGVPMNVPARRMNERVLDLVGIDLEDARLLLIDPYECVLHGDLLERASRPPVPDVNARAEPVMERGRRSGVATRSPQIHLRRSNHILTPWVSSK